MRHRSSSRTARLAAQFAMVLVAGIATACGPGDPVDSVGTFTESPMPDVDRPNEWTTSIAVRDPRFPMVTGPDVPDDFRTESRGQIVMREEEAAIAALSSSASSTPIILIRWITWLGDEPQHSRLPRREWRIVDGSLFSAEGATSAPLDAVLDQLSPVGDGDTASFDVTAALPDGWTVAEPPRPVRPAARPLIVGSWDTVGAATVDVVDLPLLSTTFGPWSLIPSAATITARSAGGTDGYFADLDGYLHWIVPIDDAATVQIGAVAMTTETALEIATQVEFVGQPIWEARYGLFGYDPVGRHSWFPEENSND